MDGLPGQPVSGARPDRPILVTGGAGFIGCNLVDRLASAGHEVIVLDSLVRSGAETNWAWLEGKHGSAVTLERVDVRERAAVKRLVAECEAVFHLAAQVAVTTSMDDPDLDFDVNLGGTWSVLGALRAAGRPVPLIFASTNKVYGGLEDLRLELEAGQYVPCDQVVRQRGISESRALAFATPYGCSKGAADQYVLDHAHSFGLRTAVMRTSCVYGPHQNGTEDQGWVAHFVRRAIAGEPITLFGDGCQVRDILHVTDAVAAYEAAWRQIERVSGRVFNLGGGVDNAVSVNEVLGEIGRLTGGELQLRRSDWRPGDQRYYVSDIAQARRWLGLAEPMGWREGLADLVAWFRSQARERDAAADDEAGAGSAARPIAIATRATALAG